MTIVDSHVHLWDPSRFRMPWLDNDTTLRRAFGLDDFDAASAGLDVDKLVYVQVDTTPAYGLLEARWAAAHAGKDARVAAVVAWAPIEDGATVRTYLDALVQVGPVIRGVRRLIQSEPDPKFALHADFLTGLRLLPAYDLSFDICVRHDQLANAVGMVRACPETRFVLDHLGKPAVRQGLLDEWRADIDALARLPNVVCKLSGLVTEAQHASWGPADLAPYVEHALAAFGENRVLFGGDWPVVTLASPYQRWVETLTELTQTLSIAAQAKLWGTNACRVYGIDR
ncbi:MAG: amidohydrolase family protein [Chloroflexota bacterium]